MNVARLLQDSPSDDHRRRQELREEQEREREKEREEDRERERERETAREIERERDREREWDRERDRAQRERNSSLSSSTTVPPPAHRPYSPLESALPPRSHAHAYDNKQTLPPASRGLPTSNQGSNHHAFAHSPGSESIHARSYSQDSHPPPSAHSHSHSPPAPLFLSPLTAPRDKVGAGPVPGAALSGISSEYSADYAYRSKSSSQQAAPLPSRFDQDRERDREYRQRAQSITGSGRPRTPPYGDYRDAGRISPTAQRVGSKQHSPSQSPYSVVPPPPPLHAQQQRYSPPLSNPLSNNNNSMSRIHPPLSRRQPQPPPSSLPPPPSASIKHSHDSKGAPPTSGMSRTYDEPPYLGRAPSSSSSVMSLGSERTLKTDLELERATYERERELRERDRERERERDRGRELQRGARSRSASAGAGGHANTPNAFNDRVSEREREMSEIHRLREMDASRTAGGQGQTREARERDAARHHHHHHHHHPLPHSHQHSSQDAHAQHLQQQQQEQAQGQGPYAAGTPYTYAHTGKPRISRSGVLKLAPPGVTVPNVGPPTSSDLVFSGAAGVVLRQETLTLAPPSHMPPNSQHRQDQQHLQGHHYSQSVSLEAGGPQPIEPIPVGVKQPSPPTLSLHGPPESRHEGSHLYIDAPQGYAEGLHSLSHPQQHPPPPGKHRPYSVVPTGPGVPPLSGGPSPPANLHASMIAVQQQQQHAPQYMTPQHSHPHQQSLPPPQAHPSSSSNGVHGSGPPHSQPNPYQHMPGGIPPQHQGYPHMHYNEVRPPPVPMALQPMTASPPMQEPTPEETPLHLGTFAFPRTPFPYFFPARGNSDSRRISSTLNISPGQSKSSARHGSDLTVERERPTHVTILVPSAHLPSSLPTDSRPRIWGGAPLSIPTPWAPFVNFVTRPHPGNARRIYTDDSDIILCALHSGRVSWKGIKRARAAGLDLSIRLALHRDVGRYIGSRSAFADGSVVEGSLDVDVGLKGLLVGKSSKEISLREHPDETNWVISPSASWDSGHDGSGFEVISAEWLPHGSTRKLGLRNRSQRLHEYTERRRVIMKEVSPDDLVATSLLPMTVLGKRPALLNDLPINSLNGEDLTAVRTIVFGECCDVESAGFKYAPTSLRSALFSPVIASSVSSDQSRVRRKRRRLNPDDRSELNSDADADGRRSPSPRRSDKAGRNRNIVLENSEESFLLVPQDTFRGTDEDKENQAIASDDANGAAAGKGVKGRRYDLYALPPPPSPPLLPASASLEGEPEIRSNGVQKPDFETPMTPRSNRSEPRSPTITVKEVAGVIVMQGVDKDDASKVDDTLSKETASKPLAKATTIPTPPATTETIHPSSLPSPSLDTVKEKSGSSKSPEILYRDLGPENIQFLDNGLSIAGLVRVIEAAEGKDTRKGAIIRVDRWRWAGSRDNVTSVAANQNLRNGITKENVVTGLGVST